jgi:hypothetical protein
MITIPDTEAFAYQIKPHFVGKISPSTEGREAVSSGRGPSTTEAAGELILFCGQRACAPAEELIKGES